MNVKMFFPAIFMLFMQLFGAEKEIAISLKNLQTCLKRGNCPKNFEKLFGLKEIDGFVIEKDKEDLIIFGKIKEKSPDLYLEDLVIAMKNSFYKYSKEKGNTIYYENPGCSIDPDGNVIKDLINIGETINSAKTEEMHKILAKWKNACQKDQNVRVMGIPFNTRFAKVMVEADYFMKRIVDGSLDLKINGFLSLSDMKMKKIEETLKKDENVELSPFSLNRFWFYPGDVSYSYDDDIFILENCPVILLTEEEYISKQGISGTGKQNIYAKTFSENFSKYYDEISNKKEIYKDLKNLFRFVAFGKILKEKVSDEYFSYFLNIFKEEKDQFQIS